MSLKNALGVAVALALVAPVLADAQNRQRATTRFAAMDTNRDGIITRAEWRGNERAFQRLDWNNDGLLSGDEIRPGAQRPVATSGRQDQRSADDDGRLHEWTEERFAELDHNKDGRLSKDEWHYQPEGFERADHNGDGVVTRQEFLGGITPDGFDKRDLNKDGRITRDEYRATADPQQTQPQSAARRAGYDRGLLEGRSAGREDRQRNQGWDLEGQRELETADSGYEPRIGSRAEYQAGYREGFRRGYREGWNQR